VSSYIHYYGIITIIHMFAKPPLLLWLAFAGVLITITNIVYYNYLTQSHNLYANLLSCNDLSDVFACRCVVREPESSTWRHQRVLQPKRGRSPLLSAQQQQLVVQARARKLRPEERPRQRKRKARRRRKRSSCSEDEIFVLMHIGTIYEVLVLVLSQ